MRIPRQPRPIGRELPEPSWNTAPDVASSSRCVGVASQSAVVTPRDGVNPRNPVSQSSTPATSIQVG
nr:hypothetical protein [Catenulispora rubra]